MVSFERYFFNAHLAVIAVVNVLLALATLANPNIFHFKILKWKLNRVTALPAIVSLKTWHRIFAWTQISRNKAYLKASSLKIKKMLMLKMKIKNLLENGTGNLFHFHLSAIYFKNILILKNTEN